MRWAVSGSPFIVVDGIGLYTMTCSASFEQTYPQRDGLRSGYSFNCRKLEKGFGCEIGAVWPDDRSGNRIDDDSREHLPILERLKNGSSKQRLEVHCLGCSIVEINLENVVTDVPSGVYMQDPFSHTATPAEESPAMLRGFSLYPSSPEAGFDRYQPTP